MMKKNRFFYNRWAGSSSGRNYVAALLLFSCTIAPLHVANAQSQTPEQVPVFRTCSSTATANDQEVAKSLFTAGKIAYDEGDVSKAIRYWLDAFDRDCSAVKMLLNLANAYERTGNQEAALLSLNTYLQRRPDANDAKTIQRRVEVLKQSVAQKPPPVPASPPSSASPPAEPVKPPPSPAPPSTTETATSSTVLPWIVTGTGGAVALTGVIVYLSGSSKLSSVEENCPNNRCTSPVFSEEGNTARSQKSLGLILTGTGAAVATGGLVWLLLSGHSNASASSAQGVRFQPHVGIHYGGFLAEGRF